MPELPSLAEQATQVKSALARLGYLGANVRVQDGQLQVVTGKDSLDVPTEKVWQAMHECFPHYVGCYHCYLQGRLRSIRCAQGMCSRP